MVARALGLAEEGGWWGGGLAATRHLAACFIDATSANVAHPFDDVVVAVVQLRFKHLQVAHLEAGGREWHLGEGQLVRNVALQSVSLLGSSVARPTFISFLQVIE